MKVTGQLAKIHPDGVIAAVLFSLFLSIYLIIGLPLLGPLVTHHMTVVGADSEAVISLLSKIEDHYPKTGRHPLFLILLNPFGWSLGKIIGSPDLAALLLNTAAGALLVALFFIVLRKVGVARVDATLFSLLLGTAVSQLILASIPETFIFTALSILALVSVHLFCSDTKTFLKWFLPLSVVAFGMAVTSLAPVTIILFLRYRTGPLWKRVVMLAGVTLGIIAVTTGLTLLQGSIYQNPIFFLSTRPIGSASSFFTLGLITEPIQHLRTFGPELFINTIVAKRGIHLQVINYLGWVSGDHLAIFLFDRPNSVLRTIAVFSVALLPLVALFFVIPHKLYKDVVFLMVGGYLLFEVLFQLMYDPAEILLFSPLFTFAWLAVIAMAIRHLRRPWNAMMRTLLIVALMSTAINNTLFIHDVLEQLEQWIRANPTL